MNIKKTVNAAFLFISAIIGAGFAAGRELNVYFFCHGFISGITGVFTAAVLFGLAAYKVLLLSSQNNIKNCKELMLLLFGNSLGRAFTFLGILFFAVIFSSMTAAFGEICKSFGINTLWARTVFCALCYAVLLFDIKGLSLISTLLCPLMLAGCIVMGLDRFLTGNIALSPPCIKIFPSAVIYVSYNILTGAAVLFAEEKYSKKESAAVAFIIFLIFFAAGSFVGAAAFGSDAALPIYMSIKGRNTLIFVYTALLLSAVFTTALSSAYCLTPYINGMYICLFGFILSLIGFSNIVEKCYFLFGVAGSGILFAVLLYPLRKMKAKKH